MTIGVRGTGVRIPGWGTLLAALAAVSCAPTANTTPTGSTTAARPAEAAAVPAVARTPQVSRLPACLTPAFFIDLLEAIQAMPDGTLDAQREQLRDWIWTVTLGRSATQTSVPDVFSGVADQSLVRDDALSHVLYEPSGPTRSVTTTTGRVLVLVEAMDEPALWANVLEAIDSEAVALGRTPEAVAVFAYEFSTARAEARVCKIRELDQAGLESAELGFRSATLATPADVERFLAEGTDLLSAECSGAGLRVSGRQRPRTQRAAVDAEQIAAFAQRPGERYISPELFGRSRSKLPAEQQRELEDSARKLEAALERTDSPKLNAETRALFASIRAWRKALPDVDTADLLLSYQLQHALDGRPGFSLDPEASAKDALATLDALLEVADDATRLGGVLRAWGSELLADAIQHAPAVLLDAVKRDLFKARNRLGDAADTEVPALLWAPAARHDTAGELAAELLQIVYGRSARQCARYDGPFAGTATGMTFFYTDLSAKFFARDWQGLSPEGEIDGFRSVVHHLGSTAWCEEPQRSATRIWFGLRDDAYVREKEGKLRFAPTAAKLFAKGSDFGGESESEPPPGYRRFIQWWAQNYSSIAGWEPQYEALNQLLKWSTVVLGARAAGNPSCLEPLRAAKVRTNLRLRSWAADETALRWRNAVMFVTSPSSGRECLPMIHSDPLRTCGSVSALVGGVTAGDLREVQAKPIRKQAPPRGLGRLAGDAQPSAVRPNQLDFERIRRGAGDLEHVRVTTAPGKLEFDAELAAGAVQAGSLGFVAKSTPIKQAHKVIEASAKSLSVEQSWNGLSAMRLKADLDGETVRVQIEPGVIERARALGRGVAMRMARDGLSLDAAARALGADALKLQGDRIAVPVGALDSPTYVVLDADDEGTADPPGARLGFVVGALDGGAHRLGEAYLTQQQGMAVWILSEDAAKQQLAGATRAAAPQRPAQAGTLQFENALRSRNSGLAAQVAQQVARETTSAQAFASMRDALTAQRPRLERDGGEPAGLDYIALQLAIAEAQARWPTAQDAAISGTLASTVVAPLAYPQEAHPPPALHPPGVELRPNQRFVSRVIELPGPFPDRTRVRTLTGQTYELRTTGARSPARADWFGPASRLTSQSIPAVVIVACSDTESSKPLCRRRFTPKQRAVVLQSVIQQVCQEPDNPHWIMQNARGCAEAIKACDRVVAGDWSTAQARNCARTAFMRFASPR